MESNEFIRILNVAEISKIQFREHNIIILSDCFEIILDENKLHKNILQGNITLNIYGKEISINLDNQYFTDYINLKSIEIEIPIKTKNDFNKIKLSEVPSIKLLRHIKPEIKVMNSILLNTKNNSESENIFCITNLYVNKDFYILGSDDIINGNKLLNIIRKELEL